jgi:hypothetical protein
MARIAKVEISKELFEFFIRGEFGAHPGTIIESNAPKDLKVLGLARTSSYSMHGYPMSLYVVCESESFDDIAEMAEPPLIEPFIYTVKHG